MDLRTAKIKGFCAPHKPLLLLSVIDLVERGVIDSNCIELSDALVRTFDANTKKYIGVSMIFKPNIGQPFYHMQNEPFWHLVESVYGQSMAAESIEEYKKKTVVYSLGRLRSDYVYAQIDQELFELLQDQTVRARLRVLLISKYFTVLPSVIMPMVVLPLGVTLLSVIA